MNEMCIFRYITEMEGPNTASIHPAQLQACLFTQATRTQSTCAFMYVSIWGLMILTQRRGDQKEPKRPKMSTMSAVLSVQRESGDAIEAVRGRGLGGRA